VLSKLLFIFCKTVGFGLLFLSWVESGDAMGFLPIMALGIMTVLRYRLPKSWPSILIDGIALLLLGKYLALSVFVISELFYRTWEAERARGLKMRDTEASRYYDLEQLQGDLLAATAQIERMTTASERARIARDIHDNAGHEIVGGYISLQTVRQLLDKEFSEKADAEILELYDAALVRLDSGVNKIREAVHNLAPLTALGVESLQETCSRFPVCEVQFTTYGDTSAVPIYCWNLLEACLNEALTNIARHAEAKQVTVNIDATPNLVRLAIENDGVKSKTAAAGIGIRNLRHRAAAVGGNISVDEGKTYRVICVVPLIETRHIQ
jgi:signal transduction histidine kinase